MNFYFILPHISSSQNCNDFMQSSASMRRGRQHLHIISFIPLLPTSNPCSLRACRCPAPPAAQRPLQYWGGRAVVKRAPDRPPAPLAICSPRPRGWEGDRIVSWSRWLYELGGHGGFRCPCRDRSATDNVKVYVKTARGVAASGVTGTDTKRGSMDAFCPSFPK